MTYYNLKHVRIQQQKYFEWCHNRNTKKTRAEIQAEKFFRFDPVLKHFIPQVPIFLNPNKKYIMDFFSMRHLSCIEIDGSYHLIKKQQSRDKKRKKYMGRYSTIKTYRITNEEILDNPHNTVDKLRHQILKRTHKLSASQRKCCTHNVLLLINRALNKIDYRMFNLPRSIRQRSVEQYIDQLPVWVGEHFGLPEATSKGIESVRGENWQDSYEKKRTG